MNPAVHNAKSTFDLKQIRAVLLDMDGVIWRGSEVLAGVPEFFLFLKQQGIPYAMATNNSASSVSEYVKRISSIGIPIEPSEILTSAVVTVDELVRTHPKGTPIFVIGGQGLISTLVECGYPINPIEAKVVIIGRDTEVNYDKLKIAGRRVLAGADFIGTNGDVTFPEPDGLAPGNGSIIAVIETMTGKKARLMGKPEPAMFLSALHRFGTTASETLMIGDRLDTDILGAQNAGLPTAMVLTGVNTAEEIGPIIPDVVYDSLQTLFAAWKASI